MRSIGKIFTLTSDMVQTIQDATDDLINQLGKLCRLIYPPNVSDCPNCIFDDTTGRSSNRYNGTGPQPFPDGTICPVCNGTGHVSTQVTKDITLLCDWEPKGLYLIAEGNIITPNSYLETTGYMSDVSDIMQAGKMLMELPIVPVISATFDLFSDPVDENAIIQGRYFSCIWKRTGRGSS